MLQVYNTLTKSKSEFKSIEDKQVKMYVCGPTVYGHLHIGNFRGAIFFNMVRNWLETCGFKVTYVYNYTDVDDKIIAKANEEKVTSDEISNRYIKAFEEDYARLGLRPHTHNPRVTEFMPQIIKFVEDLIHNRKAYVVDGEVFYSVDSFATYGKLSGKKLDELEAGNRVEVDNRKRNPQDFVLWKPAKPGEPFWESPWGNGRPGWHIECSAMIRSILGDTIDIHGGGIDLIFPHHENEIAQGEGCTGKTYCNHWMHNNFINLNDQKMSKSLGNIITGRAFMDEYGPEILKYVMLSSHYRSMMNIDDDKVMGAISGLERVYRCILSAQAVTTSTGEGVKPVSDKFQKTLSDMDMKIEKAMNDDFNTMEVIAAIFEVVREFNGLNLLKKKDDGSFLATANAFLKWINHYGKILALFEQDAATQLKWMDDVLLKKKNIARSDVEKLIELRNQARIDKDWKKSDELRDQLAGLEIEVLDGVGVGWTVKKS